MPRLDRLVWALTEPSCCYWVQGQGSELAIAVEEASLPIQ